MADDMPKVEFREFQEHEPQNNASHTKLYIRRGDTEVGMVAAHHLAGRLGADVGASVGLGKMPSVEKMVFPSVRQCKTSRRNEASVGTCCLACFVRHCSASV